MRLRSVLLLAAALLGLLALVAGGADAVRVAAGVLRVLAHALAVTG